MKLLELVKLRIERKFETVTLFEHGGATSQRSSACIDHAHLHVIPGDYDISSTINVQNSARYNDVAEFVRSGHDQRPYLMVQESGSACLVTNDQNQSQYFRRHIAKRLNRPDEWDYAACPNYDNVRKTISAFRESNEDV